VQAILHQPPKRWLFILAALGILISWKGGLFKEKTASAASPGPPFVEFESGPVRPVAKSPDGNTLFAVNTPNGTLEAFALTSGLPEFEYRVPVGLEPVAVASRNNTEVWVTNLLSDSVSIVSLTGTPHVVRTLLVGDEPRDIVFAGNPVRAFITTAHRGQQRTDPVGA
jgi:YVTN family beta-propeller protein